MKNEVLLKCANEENNYSLFKTDNFQNIHFIGICGTAMAPVAAEMKRSGLNVTGSDKAAYPPMSNLLAKYNIKIEKDLNESIFNKDTLVIVGNAISRGNKEIEYVLSKGINLISLPEMIRRRYLNGRKSIVITGTHGKTTTSAMIAYIMEENELKPGWLIGGMPKCLNFPCVYGKGNYFVIEGDEYDSAWFDKRSKFFNYNPYIGLINNIEFDHADIFENIDSVRKAFNGFINLIPQNGKLIVNGDDVIINEIVKKARCKVVSYGKSSKCEWIIKDYSSINNEESIGYYKGLNNIEGELKLRVPGEHNLMNAMAALITALNIGISVENSKKALESFTGIERRLELYAATNGIEIWDDFAHHPTAIKATISTLKNIKRNGRIWAIFEPRSNTMTGRKLENELIVALEKADCIIIGPIHRMENIPENERINVKKICQELRNKGKYAKACDSLGKIEKIIQNSVKFKDTLLLMSNGNFGGLKELLRIKVENLVL